LKRQLFLKREGRSRGRQYALWYYIIRLRRRKALRPPIKPREDPFFPSAEEEAGRLSEYVKEANRKPRSLSTKSYGGRRKEGDGACKRRDEETSLLILTFYFSLGMWAVGEFYMIAQAIGR
jgi:hypothetical protein